MKQVDFYLISNRVNDAKYKLASRLANKLQRMQKSCLIITDSETATTELDRVMWSFSDSSFLAHESIGDDTLASRVQIGEGNLVSQTVLEREYSVIINLSPEIPSCNQHFDRIAEIVEADEGSKALARQRYKIYHGKGFELKMHNIEL